MFESATKNKLRFKAPNGLVTSEDLWDLPLTQLDTIAKSLRKELREEDDSFIDNSKSNVLLELKFEVVKRVIAVKLEEREAAQLKRSNAAKKQKILEVLEEKKTGVLHDMSVEDLEKELAKLSA